MDGFPVWQFMGEEIDNCKNIFCLLCGLKTAFFEAVILNCLHFMWL
jgi:hypothetical protein